MKNTVIATVRKKVAKVNSKFYRTLLSARGHRLALASYAAGHLGKTSMQRRIEKIEEVIEFYKTRASEIQKNRSSRMIKFLNAQRSQLKKALV